MSCVMSRRLAPVSSIIARMRVRICACTVTSSAVVGSSAIRSAGLSAIVIAIITRWRIPPENSCGYWPSRAAAFWMPACSSMSTARRVAWRFVRPSCTDSASVICRPIVSTGLSEVIGS